MARSEASSKPNMHDTRESWLRDAANAVRNLFESVGHPLPEKIRFSIGFPSSGNKGKTRGECWHPVASKDLHVEIMIRADIDDPSEVLAVLMNQLVQAALPPEESRKKFKSVAARVGLEGSMNKAVPGIHLKERLNDLASNLGPLPHAALDIHWKAVGRKKTQKGRMVKAICNGVSVEDPCGYTVRLASKWIKEVGPPSCPKHGEMEISGLPDSEETGEEDSPVEDTAEQAASVQE